MILKPKITENITSATTHINPSSSSLKPTVSPNSFYLGCWIGLGLTFTFTILGALRPQIFLSVATRGLRHLSIPSEINSFWISSPWSNKKSPQMSEKTLNQPDPIWYSNKVVTFNDIDIACEEIVDLIEKLRIGEAFSEPVIAEPRGGLHERPPLIGEVLDEAIRRRHEHRRVGIERGEWTSVVWSYFHHHLLDKI